MPVFIAFVEKAVLKELGMRIDDVSSPYQIWGNKRLNETSYVIRPDGGLRSALEADERYVSRWVSCGN